MSESEDSQLFMFRSDRATRISPLFSVVFGRFGTARLRPCRQTLLTPALRERGPSTRVLNWDVEFVGMLNYPLLSLMLMQLLTLPLLVFVVLGVIVLDRLVSAVPRLVDSAMGTLSRNRKRKHLWL